MEDTRSTGRCVCNVGTFRSAAGAKISLGRSSVAGLSAKKWPNFLFVAAVLTATGKVPNGASSLSSSYVAQLRCRPAVKEFGVRGAASIAVGDTGVGLSRRFESTATTLDINPKAAELRSPTHTWPVR